MVPYSNLKQGSLVDQVFNQLKGDILSGKLKQGERFAPQDVLAVQFGVSRTVIREAQKKLSSLGLVSSQQGRGTFVSSPETGQLMEPMLTSLQLDETSTRELIESRYHLERIIVRLAAERANETDVARLGEMIGLMKKSAEAGDVDSFSTHDNAFHRELAAISKNSVLTRILETIWEMNYRFLRKFSRTEGAIERAIDFHTRIMRAIASNDSKLAEAEMEAHMTDIVRALRKSFNVDLDV